MLFRATLSWLLLICLISNTACNRKSRSQRTGEGVSLDQDVTREPKPKDAIFIDFQSNWRKFISPSAELALPVVPIKEGQPKEVWQPLVLSRCVFSADAGGYVPQMTIIWNEGVTTPPPSTPGIALAAEVQTPPQAPPKAPASPVPTIEPGKIRFDLALHFQGFEKNQFTSAIATDTDKRFNLPSNSNLVANPDALLLTGPSLFPKVLDFHTQMVVDRDNNRDIPQSTLVLRDFSPGLSYTLRMSSLGQNQWNESKQVVFSTPVCPKDF